MTTTVIVAVPDVLDPVVVQIEFSANAVPVHDIGSCDDEPSALYDERPDSVPTTTRSTSIPSPPPGEPRMTNFAADQSLHQRQLLDRASRPDLRRWLAHTASTRGCVRPVRLTGSCTPSNRPPAASSGPGTPPASMPDGVLYVPCGDRRASVCPPCAETYRADTYQLIRAGLVGGKGVPTTVAGHPAVFATLTAPSFGPVHTRVVNPQAGKVRPCRMRRDVIRCPHGGCSSAPSGTPITRRPWAAPVPGLLRPRPPRRLERLGRRTLASHHDHPQPLPAAPSNRRTGSSCGSPTARSPSTSAAASCTSTRSSASTASTLPILTRYSPHRATSPPRTSPHWSPTPSNARCSGLRTTRTRATRGPSSWGRQLDIRPLGLPGDEITAEAVAGYLAKYATKATEPTGLPVTGRMTEATAEQYSDPDTHLGRLIAFA